MEATKLTSIYEILRELFDKLNSKTTWEDMPSYVYTHYYTKTGKLRGNNWRIIKYLKNHGLETEDKFEDMVVFWNNNQSKYYHTRDENNKVVFTQVKDEYKEELDYYDYYDYLDYMNEVAQQQEVAEESMKESFNKAAKEAYDEQAQWKIEDLFKQEQSEFTPVNPFEEQIPDISLQTEMDQFDIEQELQYIEQLKDTSIYEKGVKFYIGLLLLGCRHNHFLFHHEI